MAKHDAAARLAALQERMDFVERAAPLGLWDWDVVTGHVHWSPGLEALYGLAPGRFDGSYADFQRRVHPRDRDRLESEREAAERAGRPFDLEFRIVRPDGSVRWLAARAESTFGPDGRLLRAHGLNLDVTDARQREQALRLQQAILDNMAEGVLLCSATTGQILFTNPRYDAILGYGPGELVGRHGSVTNSPAEADPMAVAQAIIAELQARGEWSGVVRNRRKDGRDIWIHANITPFEHDELGRVWVNAIADVTEAHEARLARERADAELRRLAMHTQERLEAERAALSRDLHDQLGAAFTGMRLRLQALAAQLHPDAAAEVNAIAAMAQAASVQTRAICARLRPPALDDLGIVETLRVTLDEWSAASGVRVRRQLPRLREEPPPAVTIDLFRLLQELLTNVARHARARELKVSLAERADGWTLSVTDDGVGFDPTAPTAGFGLLGLRERAQRHGGTVQVQSAAGAQGGTTVTVHLPRGAPP